MLRNFSPDPHASHVPSGMRLSLVLMPWFRSCVQVSRVVLGLGAAAVLLVVVVALIASSGGPDEPAGAAVPAASDTGYMASFSSICNKEPADMNLEMAGNYEYDTPHATRFARATTWP